MKVAFFVREFPRISETFILNQITGLIDRGHQVDIYAQRADNAPLHADVEIYRLLENTIYHKADKQIMPASGIMRLGRGLNLIMQWLPHHPMPLINSLRADKFGKWALSGYALFRTAHFLERGIDQYDIVHCHFGPEGNIGAFLKASGAIKGKLITTFYGYDVTRYVQQQGANVYDRLFAEADMILALSEVMKQQLITLGCPADKVIIHRLGIDPNRFGFKHRLPKPAEPINLFSIARLVDKKGIAYGIQAVASILKQYPQLTYSIAGDGPLRPELEALIARLGVQEQVKLLGWQEKSDIIALLHQTDILLAPCIVADDGDEEGTPTALVEACAQGIPVISTWHSGIPEVVQDGLSGLLVPERDVEALAEKLLYLLSHQQCWATMGEKGQQHIDAYYNINKLNDQLISLYQS